MEGGTDRMRMWNGDWTDSWTGHANPKEDWLVLAHFWQDKEANLNAFHVLSWQIIVG